MSRSRSSRSEHSGHGKMPVKRPDQCSAPGFTKHADVCWHISSVNFASASYQADLLALPSSSGIIVNPVNP